MCPLAICLIGWPSALALDLVLVEDEEVDFTNDNCVREWVLRRDWILVMIAALKDLAARHLEDLEKNLD